MSKIHPSACVDKRAEIGAGVEIGPHCVVGPNVVLGDACHLHNTVTITGKTTVGRNNEFFPCAVIGAAPQDLKYRGGLTELIIGDDNVFREQVTVHPGTELGGGVTSVGSHNCLLVGVHLAHDVKVGDHCVVANYVQIAGHAHIQERVHIGGVAAFHHFVTVGRLAYVAGMSRVTVDVPPFMITAGYPARVRGVNVQGMTRWNFNRDHIDCMREAFRFLFGRKGQGEGASLLERVQLFESNGQLDENTRYLCDFLKRSTINGVFGRHLESVRRDTAADRGEFYRQGSADASEPAPHPGPPDPETIGDDEVRL